MFCCIFLSFQFLGAKSQTDAWIHTCRGRSVGCEAGLEEAGGAAGLAVRGSDGKGREGSDV